LELGGDLGGLGWGPLTFGRRTQRSNPWQLASASRGRPAGLRVLDACAAHVQGREPFGVSSLASVEVGLDRAPRLRLRYLRPNWRIMGCGD
jgi:hypothetical protein